MKGTTGMGVHQAEIADFHGEALAHVLDVRQNLHLLLAYAIVPPGKEYSNETVFVPLRQVPARCGMPPPSITPRDLLRAIFQKRVFAEDLTHAVR